jgi:hypothetical protein
MEYLWDLYSVRITIEMAGEELIFSADPLLGTPTVGAERVSTLTSKSAEIYLSMAGAKQHKWQGFILVPPVGRMSSKGALRVLYCVAP